MTRTAAGRRRNGCARNVEEGHGRRSCGCRAADPEREPPMLNHRNLWRFDEAVGRVRNDDIRAGSSQISRPFPLNSLFPPLCAHYFVTQPHSYTFARPVLYLLLPRPSASFVPIRADRCNTRLFENARSIPSNVPRTMRRLRVAILLRNRHYLAQSFLFAESRKD